MPQEPSRLQAVVRKLKAISDGTTRTFELLVPEIIQDAIGDQVALIKRSFSNRLEMAASVLPPVVRLGLSKLFGKKKREEEEDDETGPTAPDTDDVDDPIVGLAGIMSDGFEETNENLDSIFQVLSEQAEEPEEAATLVEPEDQSLIILDGISQHSQTTSAAIAELVDINGRVLDSLRDIEDNTSVDELAEKVKAHNANKAAREASRRAAEARHNSDGQPGPHRPTITGTILQSILKTALGTAAGLGGYKMLFGSAHSKIANGLKGLGGGIVNGAKAMGSGALAAGGKALGALKGVKGVGGAVAALGALSMGAIKSLKPAAAPVGQAVSAAARPVYRDAKGRFTTAANAVAPRTATGAGAASAIPKAGVLSKAKSIAGKALGTPLLAAVSAYDAYQISQSDASDEDKNVGYTKVAGGMSGALAGAAIGAMTGPFAPVAVPLLGALGYFGGDYLGGLIGDAVFKKEDDDKSTKDKVVSLVTDANMKINQATDLTYKELMSPAVSPLGNTITANDAKLNRLNGLSQQFESMDSEKQEINTVINQTKVQVSAPPAAPEQAKQGMTIPSVRNQEGTIQRLLDSNFSPMFK